MFDLKNILKVAKKSYQEVTYKHRIKTIDVKYKQLKQYITYIKQQGYKKYQQQQ